MTELRVRHVADALSARFDGLIDLSDVENAGEDQREAAFRTRALAAQAVQRMASVDAETAAAAVTDGTNDNGVDAVYVTENDVVVLVQSKWDARGTGGIGLGDARNFIAGLKALTNEQFDRFNVWKSPSPRVSTRTSAVGSFSSLSISAKAAATGSANSVVPVVATTMTKVTSGFINAACSSGTCAANFLGAGNRALRGVLRDRIGGGCG
jgi:hypothetical protein